MPSGTAPGRALASAIARERALLARHGAAVHRLRPPVLRSGRLRNALRAALLAGAIVELPAQRRVRRVLDAAAEDAGVAGGVRSFRASAAGGVLARVSVRGGQHAVLRVGGTGWPGDPTRAADALEALDRAAGPIPRLLGRGEIAGASWSTETAMPGGRPRRLDADMAHAAAEFGAGLPATPGPPRAASDDRAAIAARLPDRSSPIGELGTWSEGVLSAAPAVVRHGDLWLGNFLVDGGRLSGVVDWDAWHPSGTPGADLLQLHATDRRIRTRRQMGEIWLERPWRSDAFRAAAAPYWSALGWSPGAEELDVIGAAWWAAEVAGTLSRVPERAADVRWVEANVDRVLAALPGPG